MKEEPWFVPILILLSWFAATAGVPLALFILYTNHR